MSGRLRPVREEALKNALNRHNLQETFRELPCEVRGPAGLRSADPDLRRQLQDVVRRAAATQPSPAFAGPGVIAGPPGFTPRRPRATFHL